MSCKRRALAQRECPKGSGCVMKRLRLLREGLKLEQRAQIELLHKEGHSRAEIGRRLGRHETTIGCEVRRLGTGPECDAERAVPHTQQIRSTASG